MIGNCAFGYDDHLVFVLVADPPTINRRFLRYDYKT